MEKTLTIVLDRIEKLVKPVEKPTNVQQCTEVLYKFFDEEFTNLTSVATSFVQKKHIDKFLNSMSTNIKNDTETLNFRIEALR